MMTRKVNSIQGAPLLCLILSYQTIKMFKPGKVNSTIASRSLAVWLILCAVDMLGLECILQLIVNEQGIIKVSLTMLMLSVLNDY